jgi:hypothetical protein
MRTLSGSVDIPRDRSTHVRQRELFSKLYSENRKGRCYSGSYKPRIILKLILNNWFVRMWNEFIRLRAEKIEGVCEYDNGRHFTNGEKFRDSKLETSSSASVLSIVKDVLKYGRSVSELQYLGGKPTIYIHIYKHKHTSFFF